MKKITFIFFFIIIALLVVWKMFYIQEKQIIQKTDKVFYNPLMGFAVNADYEDAVQNNTLVYVDITWREWEPEEGTYAIEQVWEENHLERWKQEAKHVVLRFVCDIPDEESHMDIPDWLYQLTKDGVFYDTSYGKGYAPEYSNSVFMEKHRAAIMALGEAFAKEDLIAYVQLGSLGHWGEWHMNYSQGTTRMPKSSVREAYVSAYEEAFPYAKLMARRPFPETAERGLGVFNDMTGHPDSTTEWLEWIREGGEYSQPLMKEQLVAQPNVWEKAPVGGEFTSSLSYDIMLDRNLGETCSLLKKSHATFIGPKCPVIEEVEIYQEGVDAVLKTIGYRYGIAEASISYWKWAKQGNMSLTIENRGIAPIYFPWQMYVYVQDENGELVERKQLSVSLMDIAGGETATVTIKDIAVGEGYSYWVAIENPTTEEPAVYLDMDCETSNLLYKLLEIK